MKAKFGTLAALMLCCCLCLLASVPARALEQTTKNLRIAVARRVKQKWRHVGTSRRSRTIHIVVDGLDRGGDIALTYRDGRLARAVVLLCGSHSDFVDIYYFTYGRLRRVQERKTRYPFVDNGKYFWDFSRPVREPTLTYSFAEDGSLRTPEKAHYYVTGVSNSTELGYYFQQTAETLQKLAVKPLREIGQAEL